MFKEGNLIWYEGVNNTFYKGKILRESITNGKKFYNISIKRNTPQGLIYKHNIWCTSKEIQLDTGFTIELDDLVTIKNPGDKKNPNGSLKGLIGCSKYEEYDFFLYVKGCNNNKELSGHINKKSIIKVVKNDVKLGKKKIHWKKKIKKDNIIKQNRKINKNNLKNDDKKSKIIIKTNINCKNSKIITKASIKNNIIAKHVDPKAKRILRRNYCVGMKILYKSMDGNEAYVTLLYKQRHNGRIRWRYLWPDDGIYTQEFRKGWL